VSGSYRSNWRKVSGDGKSLEATNQVYGTKINAETDLKNKQVAATYENTIRNASLRDAFNTKEFQRANDIQSRTSANVANAVTDFEKQGAEKNMKIKDNQILGLIYDRFNESGVLDRAGTQQIIDDVGNGLSRCWYSWCFIIQSRIDYIINIRCCCRPIKIFYLFTCFICYI